VQDGLAGGGCAEGKWYKSAKVEILEAGLFCLGWLGYGAAQPPPGRTPSDMDGRCGDRVPAVDIRASDEDRQRIVAALERHTGAGRLTLDEFADRVQVACDARTLDELAAVVSDLPTESAAAADPAVTDGVVGVETEAEPRRELFLVFAIAVVTLILLGVALALR
jgi:hypothetical protein